MTVYIYIYLYDTMIVNCLYSMGGTHSIECNSAAKDIWQFCIEREICISAALTPGENNTQAGRESIEFLLCLVMHPGDLILILFNYMGNSFSIRFSYLVWLVKVEAEGITTVSLWPTQPCLAVTLDSRCAKETSTATEHAPNAREKAWGSSISKDVPNGFQIIRQSLEV